MEKLGFVEDDINVTPAPFDVNAIDDAGDVFVIVISCKSEVTEIPVPLVFIPLKELT